MEFAVAALSTMGSSVAAGASAVGSSIAAGASSVGSLFSGLSGVAGTATSILSGGATVLSVLNAQRAGEMKAQALTMQAEDADMSTQVEAIQGTDRRASLKAQLTQAIGDRDVAAAASGVDLSFGTPSTARAQAVKDGERALSLDQSTTDLRIARLRERAAGFRAQASGASAAGLGTAAALALDGGAKLMRRG